MGWYTTEDYQEGTEITEIKAGSSGEINIYPKFAAPEPYREARDGFVYVPFGAYPQTRVKDYTLLKQIKASAAYVSVGSGGEFTYNSVKYYKFKPGNYPNVIENGYSSTSYYVFKVEPIWWRVLTTPNSAVSSGSNYTLLAKNILTCSPFRLADDGWLISQYQKYADQLDGDISSFERYIHDPDTVYERSDLRTSIRSIYNNWIAPNANTAHVRTRTFTKYTSQTSSNTENYVESAWALSFSEARNSSYGFNASWEEMDGSRQAVATDFALASGVYSSKTKAYIEKGSWWLRGSGSTYAYKDKRIAYVKYTGKLHSYTALNYSVRSGVRPSMNIQAWFSVTS